MATAGQGMTKGELQSFLSSGVINAAKTFIWATVKDTEGRISHQQKYVCQYRQGYPVPHAERQLIDKLTKGYQGSRLVDRAQRIEIFTNYSPCLECAELLLQLKSVHPRLSIIIKCAHLYRVQQGQSLDKKNIEGLQNLQSAGIQVKSFTGDDWLRLLSETSSLRGYDYLQPEGREAADQTTRRGLEICHRKNLSLSAKANEIQCLYDCAIADAYENEESESEDEESESEDKEFEPEDEESEPEDEESEPEEEESESEDEESESEDEESESEDEESESEDD